MGRAMDRLARLRAKGVIIDTEWDILAIRQDKHSEEYDASVKKVEEAKLKAKQEKELQITNLRNRVNASETRLVPSGFKDYEEELFVGWTLQNRYYQALHYKRGLLTGFGMECNAVTLMYLLQSLGLYPTAMARKEFEYAFTTIQPYEEVIKSKDISISGILKKGVKPVTKLSPPLELIHPLFSQDALLGVVGRGVNGGISLVGQTLQQAITKLEGTVSNFAEKLPTGNNYEFVKESHKDIVKKKVIEKTKFIVDLSDKLASNSIPDAYFESGGSVFVCVDYGDKNNAYSGGTKHYSLIVGSSIAKFTHKNKIHYFYPADDALWGRVLVIIPCFIGNTSEIKLDGMVGLQYTYNDKIFEVNSAASSTLQIGISI